MASLHTPEFRAEAVRIALTGGLPRGQVTNDLGVGLWTLKRWISLDRSNPERPQTQSEPPRVYRRP